MKSARVAVFAVVLGLAGLPAAIAAQVDITVNKVSQKMTVKVDGATEYVWPVSTGASGYDTPSGNFKPFRMEEDHFSEEWDNAPMPHSIFFTGEGHAIHGSMYVKSLGKRASHGCVRLSPQNAETLYNIVAENGLSHTRVTIKGGFFDFGFDEGPLLPKGFKLGSKQADASTSAKKGKKKRFSLFGDL